MRNSKKGSKIIIPNNLKTDIKLLTKRCYEFKRFVRKNKDYEKIIEFHRTITCKYSNVKLNNFIYFYSGNMKHLQYIKNIAIIKKFDKKYVYTNDLLIGVLSKRNDLMYKNKYLRYLFSNSKLNKNGDYANFYNNFTTSTHIENKKIDIYFSNVYDLMDYTCDHKNREKIYNSFMQEIIENERKIATYISNHIINNLSENNYFLNKLKKNNINSNYVNKCLSAIEESNIINKYILFKRHILKSDDLIQIELFSYNYEYISHEKFKLENIPQAFSLFGKSYMKNLVYNLKNHFIISDNITEKGLTINDLNGNSFTLMKALDKVDDIFVASHELGHLMYNYYSKNKIIDLKDIIISEISAITNEIILNNYLFRNNILNNIYFLDSFLKILANGTVNYRLLNYIYIENISNYDIIKSKYSKIIDNIYDNKIKMTNADKNFIIDNNIYDDVSPLRYMLSFFISINIFEKLKNNNNYFNKYIEFLKSASSYDNLEDAVKILDIDLTDDEIYKNTINYLVMLIDKEIKKY